MADEKGIEHRFCDPTQEERVAIGYMDCRAIWQQRMGEMLPGNELYMKAQAIEIACYFPIREQFWLEKLDGCRNESVIFVCGDGHIETFCKLLERESIEHEVVKRGIGRDGRDDEFYRAVQYLKEHPELSECAG